MVMNTKMTYFWSWCWWWMTTKITSSFGCLSKLSNGADRVQFSVRNLNVAMVIGCSKMIKWSLDIPKLWLYPILNLQRDVSDARCCALDTHFSCVSDHKTLIKIIVKSSLNSTLIKNSFMLDSTKRRKERVRQ